MEEEALELRRAQRDQTFELAFRLHPFRHDLHVERVRQLGYAGRNTGLLEGMAGVAVPICDREGRAVAALSVGTISARLNDDRLPTVVELLKREATAIGPRIHPFDATLRRPAQSLSSVRSDQALPPAEQE